MDVRDARDAVGVRAAAALASLGETMRWHRDAQPRGLDELSAEEFDERAPGGPCRDVRTLANDVDDAHLDKLRAASGAAPRVAVIEGDDRDDDAEGATAPMAMPSAARGFALSLAVRPLPQPMLRVGGAVRRHGRLSEAVSKLERAVALLKADDPISKPSAASKERSRAASLASRRQLDDAAHDADPLGTRFLAQARARARRAPGAR